MSDPLRRPELQRLLGLRYQVTPYCIRKKLNVPFTSQLRGVHSSYEREYYDLIRGAFLKYAFQLKIGQMDGAFRTLQTNYLQYYIPTSGLPQYQRDIWVRIYKVVRDREKSVRLSELRRGGLPDLLQAADRGAELHSG